MIQRRRRDTNRRNQSRTQAPLSGGRGTASGSSVLMNASPSHAVPRKQSPPVRRGRSSWSRTNSALGFERLLGIRDPGSNCSGASASRNSPNPVASTGCPGCDQRVAGTEQAPGSGRNWLAALTVAGARPPETRSARPETHPCTSSRVTAVRGRRANAGRMCLLRRARMFTDVRGRTSNLLSNHRAA